MADCLVVSLSGLPHDDPAALARGAEFAAELDARGVPLSQLFRPGGSAGPAAGSPLVRWLHTRSGDAVVLHGYDHSADPLGSGQLARVGRRAEFAALPRHEAGLRLIAARRALTSVGLRTDAFVPPRWLASPGTVEALREQRFAVCADETGVRLLRGPVPVLRARVLGFRASGEKRPVADDRRAAEAWRARVLLAEVVRTARRGGLVRINVRAKDLKRAPRVDAVLAAVDAAVALGAVPTTYRELAATARAA
jgi:predicted deacetylase